MSAYDELAKLNKGSDMGTTYRVALSVDGKLSVDVETDGIMVDDFPHADSGTGNIDNLPDDVTIVHEFHDSEVVSESKHWEYHLSGLIEDLEPGSAFLVECQPISWDNDNEEMAEVEPTILEGWVMILRWEE